MELGYLPSREQRTEQLVRRIKGTVKGHWYRLKNMTWLSCILCAAITFFVSAIGLCWLAAGFFITAHKSDIEVYHKDGYYGPVVGHIIKNKCEI